MPIIRYQLDSGRIPSYVERVKYEEWGELHLLEEIEESISAIHEWYEKDRIDKDRLEELLDKYEMVRQSIKNCKDVKAWDEG